MAQKKRTKKTSKRKIGKPPVNKASKRVDALPRRIAVAWKNFILFLIIFILSFVLYNFSTTELFINFFGVLSIITGFIFLTFLIAFIILMIISYSRLRGKKKLSGKPKSKKSGRKRKK